MGVTITALADRVQTEADAYKFLEELRWPTGTPTCPHCGNIGADFIRPATSRKSKSHSAGAVGVYAPTSPCPRDITTCASS